MSSSLPSWRALEDRALRIVEKTMAGLPADLLIEARKVPVLFQKVNDEDPDILGTYGNFEPGELSAANGPIILYLATIAEYCADEGAEFATEVRLTYLHELGHHFGWDEGDLEARGLG